MKTTEFISENELIGQDAQIMHEENKTQSMRVKLHSIAVNSVAIHKLLPKLGKNGIAGNSDIVLYADAINEAESLLQHVLEEVEFATADHNMDPEMEAFNPTIAETKFVEATDTVKKDDKGNVVSWQHSGDWKKAEKNKDGKDKDPSGKVANLSDKARRETEKQTEKKTKVKEDATGGSSMSSSVAVTPQTLGEKGTFSKKEVNKKLGGYSNVLTRGGPVKAGKSK